MPQASECQYAILFAYDDWVDMQNNLTLELEYSTFETINPMMPILKIFEVVGTNVSWVPPHCW